MFETVRMYQPKRIHEIRAAGYAVENMDRAHEIADMHIARCVGFMDVSIRKILEDWGILDKGLRSPGYIIEQALRDWEDYSRANDVYYSIEELNVLRSDATFEDAVRARIAAERAMCSDRVMEELMIFILLLCEHSYLLPVYNYQMLTKLAFEPDAYDQVVTYLFEQYREHGDYAANNIDQTFTEIELLFDESRVLNEIKPDLDDIVNFGGYKITRTFHTEATDIMNEGIATASEFLAVARYKYLTERDEKVCELCGPLDGRSFRFSQRQRGVNFPWIHPNCRCTAFLMIGNDSINAMLPKAELERAVYRTFGQEMPYDAWLDVWGIDYDGWLE